jgi:hypothetical protein
MQISDLWNSTVVTVKKTIRVSNSNKKVTNKSVVMGSFKPTLFNQRRFILFTSLHKP